MNGLTVLGHQRHAVLASGQKDVINAAIGDDFGGCGNGIFVAVNGNAGGGLCFGAVWRHNRGPAIDAVIGPFGVNNYRLACRTGRIDRTCDNIRMQDTLAIVRQNDRFDIGGQLTGKGGKVADGICCNG